VSEALEHGLEKYEQRHPKSKGVVQGSVVVLKNSDGSILAETGGRRVYHGRDTTLADFNRARQSMRQPGSTMKPFVYLAAFDLGAFTLESLVPDEPISVPDGVGKPEKWIANYDGQFRGLIPVREALAESRNAVAVWMTSQIGIDAVLRTASSLGVRTRLQRYATTALGASEVSLLELATAYRTIASGIVAQPYVVREVVSGSRGTVALGRKAPVPLAVNPETLALIQEGLRGVVRMPTGTAHALTSRSFPIPVMGKTGTTNDFKDALFVGSTYGQGGITVAVRIGFDDGRSLGSRETGGRLALPVFREVVLRVYQDELVGKAPTFPRAIERRITEYLTGPLPPAVVTTAGASSLVTIR
jgi:penicillin-binding protein 1A